MHKLNPLPVKIEPSRYAIGKREIDASVELSSLPRIKEYLRHVDGSIRVKLSFARDEQNRVVIHMHTDGVLALTCQRCLDELSWPVHSEHIVCPVASESEVALLPESYEPVLLEEDFISPVAIVEEELILNLPLIPMHAEEDCSNIKNSAYYGRVDINEAESEPNPFALLAELKKKFK